MHQHSPSVEIGKFFDKYRKRKRLLNPSRLQSPVGGRNLVYVIPVGCLALFLLLCALSINPVVNDKTNALEVDEEDLASEGAENAQDPENTESVPDESFGGFAETDFEVSADDAEAGIMPLALVAPYAKMSVSSTNLSSKVGSGETAYLSSDVTYSANYIKDYYIQVSYADGYDKMQVDGGNSVLSGANGTTVVNMPSNSWGFSWADTTTPNESLTYYTMPAYGTVGSNINTGRLEGGAVSNIASTTKKIVFAAKFGDSGIQSGHYRASVLLSLVSTPIDTVKWNITYMQEMTKNICAAATIGTSSELIDNRDNNAYTVTKLDDGNCWMTQNLRLIGSKTLNSSSSDVSSSWTLPATKTSLVKTDFNVENQTQGGDGHGVIKSYYDSSTYNTDGVYYSFCAATANSCRTYTTTSGSVATYSICPKGWKLPTTTQYTNLTTAAGITSSAEGSEILLGSPYSFALDGHIGYGEHSDIGKYGWYWTNRPSNGSDGSLSRAWSFRVGTTFLGTYSYNWDTYGQHVRCIATSS